ncbi:hypothetical protein GCM10011399_28590 [Subtercola lobariae]|uniref:Luciferase-like domain-containing protein n=1 Tax=Subtercola lobariae TaxID=1588641 RepID=A0A917F1K9_9MICO|nr:hypothetical protein GCM10011399_28590 [Subtercola lobariae]
MAKIAATVDHISGGRLEVGVGGGWYETEWRAYGYGFPPIGERLERLREGVEILRRAWTTGAVTLEGKHFQATDAIVQPRPLQPGGPSLWVAGAGPRVTLRIAAEFADFTNFGAEDLDEFLVSSAILRSHCDAIGRDYETITRSAEFSTIIGISRADVDARIARLQQRFEQVLDPGTAARFIRRYLNSVAVGTPDEVVERLKSREAAGLGYAIHYFPEAAFDRSGIDLFEQEVMPALEKNR